MSRVRHVLVGSLEARPVVTVECRRCGRVLVALHGMAGGESCEVISAEPCTRCQAWLEKQKESGVSNG